MRVSTHAGDRGKTGLFSGERVSKAAERVHACGEVDELNAVVGALAAVLQGSVAIPQELTAELRAIQSELFRMGAWLSTTPGSPVSEELPRLDPDAVTRIESAAERLESELAPLKGFILPGGDLTACWAHLARTVCRRAERRVVAVLESTIAAKPARGTDLAQGSAGEAGEEQDADDMVQESNVIELAVRYLNRLSDYFFVFALFCNHKKGVPEILWKP